MSGDNISIFNCLISCYFRIASTAISENVSSGNVGGFLI